jgi:hypothetical protein
MRQHLRTIMVHLLYSKHWLTNLKKKSTSKHSESKLLMKKRLFLKASVTSLCNKRVKLCLRYKFIMVYCIWFYQSENKYGYMTCAKVSVQMYLLSTYAIVLGDILHPKVCISTVQVKAVFALTVFWLGNGTKCLPFVFKTELHSCSQCYLLETFYPW